MSQLSAISSSSASVSASLNTIKGSGEQLETVIMTLLESIDIGNAPAPRVEGQTGQNLDVSA